MPSRATNLVQRHIIPTEKVLTAIGLALHGHTTENVSAQQVPDALIAERFYAMRTAIHVGRISGYKKWGSLTLLVSSACMPRPELQPPRIPGNMYIAYQHNYSNLDVTLI